MKEILYLSEELAARARTEGISESEIVEVVARCRAETALVFDPQTEAYTCCAPIGNIMLWVRFHIDFPGLSDSGASATLGSSCATGAARQRHSGLVPESKRSDGDHGMDSDARIVVEDWYFNRTTMITVQDQPPTKGAKLSPLLAPWVERGLCCVRCDRTLELRMAEFQYLKQRYRAVLLTCPACACQPEPQANCHAAPQCAYPESECIQPDTQAKNRGSASLCPIIFLPREMIEHQREQIESLLENK